MVLAWIGKRASESLLLASTGKFSKLLRREKHCLVFTNLQHCNRCLSSQLHIGWPIYLTGSFSSTNKGSQSILSQVWNIFCWKAFTTFFLQGPCCWHTGSHYCGALETNGQAFGWYSGLRRDSGIHEEHQTEGSLIHVAVNKSFISCKNASLPKQPPKWHYNSILPSGIGPAKLSNWASIRSIRVITTHQQRKVNQRMGRERQLSVFKGSLPEILREMVNLKAQSGPCSNRQKLHKHFFHFVLFL